jgi:cytochrome c peroxidase
MMRFHTKCMIAGALLAAVMARPSLATAQTAAELAAIKRDHRRPPPLQVANPALAGLGRELFTDRQISASGNTACASCHFRELGWAVTDARSLNDSGKLTSRKSQPLLGIGYAGSAPVNWDGRSATLEAQAKSSIATGSMSMQETATPVKVDVIETRIRSNPAYVAKFNDALPGAPINVDTIALAIAAFERSLEPGVSPFDRWIEGDEQAISESAKRGFALFTSTKAMCFTCHTGWRFTDDRFHDIGTTTTDIGRGRVVQDDVQAQYAFKTPTLRSVALRPPYMHDGSLKTLDDVLKHYELGGIERPSRSPLMMPIKLSGDERRDLITFMETLTEEARTGGPATYDRLP